MTTASPTKDNLNQSLHPEWIQCRYGSYGKKLFYLETNHATKLADSVFGPNGWTKEIKHTVTDFCEVAANGVVTVAVAATVRVTLHKNGSFHEDIGYGTGDHPTIKAIAMEKAYLAAGCDGMKRALRKFGNVLGNCLYDTGYLQSVDPSVPPPSPPIKFVTPLPSPISVAIPHLHQRPQPLDPFSPSRQPISIITVQQQRPLTTCDKEEALVARRKRQRISIKKETPTTTAQQNPSVTPLDSSKNPKPLSPQRSSRTTAAAHQPPSRSTRNASSPQRQPTRTTLTAAQPLSSKVTPLSLMTRSKSSRQRQPPPAPRRSPVTLETHRPRLVAQDSFPFDEQDEAWFIEMTNNTQTDMKLLQRTCRENSHSSPTQSRSPSHH